MQEKPVDKPCGEIHWQTVSATELLLHLMSPKRRGEDRPETGGLCSGSPGMQSTTLNLSQM